MSNEPQSITRHQIHLSMTLISIFNFADLYVAHDHQNKEIVVLRNCKEME